MKILVLAGGLSPERNVSLSSGALVCQALRDRGHQAALIDLFFGLDGTQEPGEALYAAPIPEELKQISPQAPDLEAVQASRKSGGASAIGPGVLELCHPVLFPIVLWYQFFVSGFRQLFEMCIRDRYMFHYLWKR